MWVSATRALVSTQNISVSAAGLNCISLPPVFGADTCESQEGNNN